MANSDQADFAYGQSIHILYVMIKSVTSRLMWIDYRVKGVDRGEPAASPMLIGMLVQMYSYLKGTNRE